MANFFNPYPYPQYGYQMQQNQQVQPQQIQNGGFLTAPNEEYARNYPVALGNSVTFKDENAPYVYTKTMGFSQLESPTFDKYRLVKEEPKTAKNEAVESETSKVSYDDLKSEIEALKREVKDIRNRVENSYDRSRVKPKKEASDDT